MIPRQLFNNAYDSFLFRFHQCIATDGRHLNKFIVKNVKTVFITPVHYN